jgi:PAS domain S-box-containing protein
VDTSSQTHIGGNAKPESRKETDLLAMCSRPASTGSPLGLQRRYAALLRRGKCATFAARHGGDHPCRALAEMVPQLVAVVDRSLRLVYVNERCRVYTGQTAAELNTGSLAWTVHPQDQHFAVAARAAIEANAAFTCAVRLRRTDGVYHRHSLCAEPLKSGLDYPRQWLLLATDIEDRRLTDKIIGKSVDRSALAIVSDTPTPDPKNLREANRLLVMAEGMTHVGHYRMDLVSNGAYWSDEVYRTYGLPTTFTPTPGWMLSAYHPDDRDRVIEIIRQTLVDGEAFTFSARIVRPDGTLREVTAGGQAERAPDGKIVGLFGVFQDVTTIKDGEREREKLSERVMVAAKAGNIGIWEWSIAADRLDWDSVMYDLYGIDDRSTRPSFDFWVSCIHPADRTKAQTDIRRALDGEPFNSEFRIIRPTGKVRYLRATGTLLHDPSGSGSRIVGANWDITEVRLLTDDLCAEKERALEANNAKSDFLARMSHEIRTPMNGIIGFTTLILDGSLSAEQRRFATLLRDAGRSLLAVINDILDFSKLAAGKVELEHIPLNLNALVDGALSIVRNEALPKGIVLDDRLADDLPAWVNGDPTRLRQTLLNLLTNALKFTEHGSIRISVRREPSAHADRIRFEIADTGIGIAADARHLLFRDFSQLEKSTTRRFGGTGLGLAICKHLVEAMGGTIGVESEPGAGSVFWFTADLPEIAAPPLGNKESPPALMAPRRILVAEDNPVNRVVVESLLKRDGHEIVLVENGTQAVEKVRLERFDLVLMDMQMPIMDGIEATRAIRALACPAALVPIVALTANAMAVEVELCRTAGMNDHVAKPIDGEGLRRAIASWAYKTHAPESEETLLKHEETAGARFSRTADTATLGISTLLDILDGDRARVDEVFDTALELIEADLIRIEQSLTLGDLPTVLEAAHRIKGTSGSIRSQHLMQISAEVQQAAHENSRTIERTLLPTLNAAVAEFRRDLNESRRP